MVGCGIGTARPGARTWAALLVMVATLLAVGTAGAGESDPSVLGVPCSQIGALHLDRQLNIHAGLIVAGCAGTRPAAQPSGSVGSAVPTPFAQVGGTDRDVVNPPDSATPHDVQAGTMVAANGQRIVVDMTDSTFAASSPSDYSGLSLSTDGGSTWTRIHPFGGTHGANYGDPFVVWDQKFGRFVAGDLVGGCGGFGLGVWTSPDGATWSVGPCVHNGTQDDRPSIAVDNDPASPYYGNLYITWNDFNINGGALVYSRSIDGGATWSPEAVVVNAFVRNTQPAVQPVNGQVDLVAVNEGGGGLNPRTNQFFRSVDGGASWQGPFSMGPSFPAGADMVVGYFSGYHPIWRALGWGNPAPAGPTTIVYPYYQAGSGGDTGDVYVVRSIDGGVTWSAPVPISTAPNAQWFSQAVSNDGNEVAIWYYSRERSTDGDNYEIYASKSHDAGATWSTPARLSDLLVPQPVQNDPMVNPFFGGDYNVTTSDLTSGVPSKRLLMTWTDGRNLLKGLAGNYIFSAAADVVSGGGVDVGNHCDDCVTAVALPFPVTFYGTSYSSVNVSSNGVIDFGNTDASFSNGCLTGNGPRRIAAFWDDLRTDGTGGGWF